MKSRPHDPHGIAEKGLSRGVDIYTSIFREAVAQEDEQYGKGKLGSELPEELQRRQERLERIRQARLELEVETAAAAARERAEQAAAAEAAAATESEEQEKLRRKVVKAQEKAEAARDLAIEKAEAAGMEPPDLEPLPTDAMPRRGLAHRADGSPTAKAQRNHRFAEGFAYVCHESNVLMNTDATTSRMGVWPPGAGLQGQAPNRPMLLRLNGVVVSDGEKADLIRQVSDEEMSVSESLRTHRKGFQKLSKRVQVGGTRMSVDVTCLRSTRQPVFRRL